MMFLSGITMFAWFLFNLIVCVIFLLILAPLCAILWIILKDIFGKDDEMIECAHNKPKEKKLSIKKEEDIKLPWEEADTSNANKEIGMSRPSKDTSEGIVYLDKQTSLTSELTEAIEDKVEKEGK